VTEAPNILLVVMDSVRAANCSAYGYERPTTPALESLAAQGTLYEQAISVGSWTLPVHATMFTGLYQSSHGLRISGHALPEDYPTLARRLGELGYATACFSNNPYISLSTGLAQGFAKTEDLWRETRPRGTAKPKGARIEERLAAGGAVAHALRTPTRAAFRARRRVKRWREWTGTSDSGAARANGLIRDWIAAERRAGAPFFCFVNYMETHERYTPPYPYNRRFLEPGVSRWRAASLGTKTDILSSPPSQRATDLGVVRSLYDGALAYLDLRVGELVESLDTLGVADETVVVVTSDHGDSLGEHDHLGHRVSLYEPLVRVPLVVRHPRLVAAGHRATDPVQLGDLFPTLLELAGDSTTEATAGGFRSLLSTDAPRTSTVAENTTPKALGSVEQRMLRRDPYKLIVAGSGTTELYDLEQDPGEERDLSGDRPDLVATMSAELDEWQARVAGKRIETREADFDDETLRRLQGLGYVG
jgi:arylsulfatase A-like enzyme